MGLFAGARRGFPGLHPVPAREKRSDKKEKSGGWIFLDLYYLSASLCIYQFRLGGDTPDGCSSEFVCGSLLTERVNFLKGPRGGHLFNPK